MTRTRLVCTALTLTLLLLVGAPGPLAASGDGALDDRIVYLDAGHGGSDPGAVNEEHDLFEKEINLDVALAVKADLEAQGATVHLSRLDNDTYLTNADRYNDANETGADILVSIHTNSVLLNADTVDGSMALYFQDDDKVLAGAIYEITYPYVRDARPADITTFTDWGLRKYASGVLMKSDMPATILEPVCMSNPHEAELLVAPVADCPDAGNGECRRAQIAQAIYDGIVNYFAEYYTPGDDGGDHPGRPDKPPRKNR